MDYIELVKVSIASLIANKLRATLTMLGIVVGIFSIIVVMTLVTIVQDSIEGGFSQLGTNTFQIQKLPPFRSGDPKERAKFQKRRNITFEDYQRLKEVLVDAKYVGAERWKFGQIIKFGNKETNPNVPISGITPEAMFTNQWIVKEGRDIRSNDVDYATNVAVIGRDIASKLFPNINPVGLYIKIQGQKFEVVGMLDQMGQRFGQSRDNLVIIPITSFFKIFGEVDPFIGVEGSINITVMSTSKETYNETIEKAIGAFRTIRKVPPGEENDFDIFSNESLISQVNDVTDGVKIGVFVIAAIALLAAGVGIMNIMLVSVTERTKEIGIRKAVGAVNKNILIQFLIEAVILCLAGGIIGILLGVISGNIVASLIGVGNGATIPIVWVILGVLLCVIVGITFGTYPAYKAANLDPIEALRYE